MKILVTGMSGLIGGALAQELRGDHELTAFNRSAVSGFACVQADLSDSDALLRAAQGQDVVVHLAAKAGENYTWEELRDTNIEGTRHVFEAASQAGVQRVVFASSGATISGYEHIEPYRSLVSEAAPPAHWDLIGVEDPVRPAGVYGSTKVWGEALARHHADVSDTHFVCVRIGYVNAEDNPDSPRARSVWCSQRDVVQALSLATLTPLKTEYATFFAGSDNARNYRDLQAGQELLGYVPRDGAPP